MRTNVVRWLIGPIFLALVAGVASVPASAQAVAKLQPEFLRVLQPPTPGASLEVPVSAKLADRLGQVWFDTAEPACREARSLTLASYHTLARAMLMAAGERMRELAANILDSAKAETEFAANAGAGATEELRRLVQEPVIAQLRVHLNQRAAVEQILHYLENIERALLLHRIRTKGHANPLATGDSAMLEEIEKVTGAALEYADLNKSKSVDRFFELVVIAQKSVLDASRQEDLLQWGPGKLMPILEGPLKEHCIAKP